MQDTPPVCDYEGSDYRERFWEGKQREYEDQVERIALRRLMPQTGQNLVEIGAGYGRLADEYAGYQTVVLFDYSRSLLREAQSRLQPNPRYLYVAGNWYALPFVSALFDTIVQVRTIHHAADVSALLAQLASVARPHGAYILEFANKRNLKAILRYWIGRQAWSPFAPEPVEFVELNYDFHPTWMRRQLAAAGFKPRTMLPVSHFRIATLKRLLPNRLLVDLDSLLQKTGRWQQLSPSVFIKSEHPQPDNGLDATTHGFFACPKCRTPLGDPVADRLVCPNQGCAHQWRFAKGLYDFKEPINDA